MPKLAELYEDLYALGAVLVAEYAPLPGNADATVVGADGLYGVFYDLNLIDSMAKEKVAAAHEWAHIATGATYTLGATASMIQAAERKATRAQIKKLLPFEEMRAAMDGGYTEPHELADYFEVTEDLIREAIAYYTGPCGLSFQKILPDGCQI